MFFVRLPRTPGQPDLVDGSASAEHRFDSRSDRRPAQVEATKSGLRTRHGGLDGLTFGV